MSRSKLFVSYSHLDQEWRDRLASHLAVLERAGLVDVWVDTRIGVGSEWRGALDAELRACQVAVLLISANYLGSAFISDVEVKTLLERHERDGLLLLPVIARPCAWRLVEWLAVRQCRPEGGRALSWGADPEVDRDLATLTYEIGTLLGQARPAAVDEMARLSFERSGPRTEYQARKPPEEPIPDLSGRSWRGQYSGVRGGRHRSIALNIKSSNGIKFSGRATWDEEAATTVRGRIMRVPSRLEDDGVWANVIRQAKGPLCALRFTDPAQLGGPRVQLNGDYRAILQHDMSLVGLWYPNETALEPIGTFALHSDRPR